jgi:hypothetical protein
MPLDRPRWPPTGGSALQASMRPVADALPKICVTLAARLMAPGTSQSGDACAEAPSSAPPGRRWRRGQLGPVAHWLWLGVTPDESAEKDKREQEDQEYAAGHDRQSPTNAANKGAHDNPLMKDLRPSPRHL